MEPETPRVESLVDDTPNYEPLVWVSTNAQNWSRVTAPTNKKISPGYKFCLTDDRFSVTETEGIIYVKNAGHFKVNEKLT